jgi:hypothetical protein
VRTRDTLVLRHPDGPVGKNLRLGPHRPVHVRPLSRLAGLVVPACLMLTRRPVTWRCCLSYILYNYDLSDYRLTLLFAVFAIPDSKALGPFPALVPIMPSRPNLDEARLSLTPRCGRDLPRPAIGGKIARRYYKYERLIAFRQAPLSPTSLSYHHEHHRLCRRKACQRGEGPQ